MEWTEPDHGDKRIKTRFLLWPLKIDKRTRWLEKATWEEFYMGRCGRIGGGYWSPTRWIDIEED